MRILQIGKFWPPPFGGIEAHVKQLAEVLQFDHDVTVGAPAHGWVTREFTVGKIHVAESATLAKIGAITVNPFWGSQLRALHQRKPFDLIHMHLPNPIGQIAVDMARAGLDKVPLVLTWHSDIVKQQKLLKVYWPYLRRLTDRARSIIVPTQLHFESSTQLKALNTKNKIRVAPMGIAEPPVLSSATQEHIDRLREVYRGKHLIISTGRHVYYKGFEYLVRAAKDVDPSAVVVLIGSGPLTGELQALATEQGVADRIKFAGSISQDELEAYMATASLFVLPSVERSEAFGLASAEAMIRGVPVVCCELGNGVNYLNQPGKTGFTVPPRDPGALAVAINTVLRDPDLRRQMGAQAAAWVRQEFSLERMKTDIEAVYRDAL